MLSTALKGLMANRVRLLLTAMSVVLGVAFIAGSFVFTDTINARFETLFTDVYAGIDATVRPIQADAGSPTGSIDESLLPAVTEVDGVDVAVGGVGGFAQIIDADGKPIRGQGPPTLGMSWVEEPSLNVLRIDSQNGRPPAGPGEVAIDVATAQAHDFSVGDTVSIQTETGLEKFTLVGLANFGTEDNLAGATLAAFELAEAQRLFDMEDKLTSIDVLAATDVNQADLIGRVADVVPQGVEVVTGEQQTNEQIDAVTEGLGFLGTALLAFAGVAVFVGAFVIQNTFRITVAQRVRELALMRAVGATGSQVTTMVLLEALVLAVVASAIGVIAGIGVAKLIGAGMAAVGIGIPDGPLTVLPRTVVVAMSVGVTVTVLAALLPARRASTVSPVAAMSEGMTTVTRRSLRTRAIVGTAGTTIGAALMTVGLMIENGSSLALVAAGSVVVFLGLSTLAPLLAIPMARLLATPLRGITGKLARENTLRQPRRTASTASALMIGVALVAFVSIFAASIRTSIGDTIEGAFPADLAFVSTNVTSELSSTAIDRLADHPDVATVSAIHGDHFSIDDREVNVAGVDPETIGAVYDSGSSIEWSELGTDILVHSDELDENGWSVGDAVDITYSTGTVATSRIAGTITDKSFGNYVIADDVLTERSDTAQRMIAFANLAPGVSLDNGALSAAAALEAFPNIDINTKAEHIAEAEAAINQMVALFSGLLSLAIIIAVLGIANTLALSVVERTREIGLLRAVGMARRQVRRMIRSEAVITALFGAILGVLIGSAIGFGVVSSLADEGLGSFSIPGAQLGVWLVVAAVAGVIAAVGPARKAARMDVLRAISHD